MLLAALMLSACPDSGVGTPSYEFHEVADGSETQGDEPGTSGGGGKTPPAPPDSPPKLVGESVSYNEAGGLMQNVKLTFNVNVRVTELSGNWNVAGGDGGSEISFTPPDDFTAGINVLAFTAVNMVDENKTLAVNAEVALTNGLFVRPDGDAQTYITEYYKHGAAGLRRVDSGDTETDYLYIKKSDADLRRILAAVCQPETPPSVLGLFNITVGGTTADRIEIRGTELPPSAIINIGLPAGGAENGKLPAFHIPYRGLGKEGGSYPNIKFMVQRDATLVIEADEEQGDGYGYLANAVIEVAGGGKLRSEAAEGFPLGQGGVVISRLNSYLAVGKDDGWLIGPFGVNPVIAWGTGDQNGGYIEIREEGRRIAFDADLHIIKTLRLAYSLWFIGCPALNIAATDTVEGKRGLFTDNGTRKFYGTSSKSGGQNTAVTSAKVIVSSGSSLSKSFLTQDNSDAFITANGDKITIPNIGGIIGPDAVPFTGNTKKAYWFWKLPN
jgi:hypothetical protein